jgi:hypothetical protein
MNAESASSPQGVCPVSGRPQLTEEGVRAFEADAKIALLATQTPMGHPHVTLITSLQARTPRELMFGQFCEGLSKQHLRVEPRAGVLVMTSDRRIWRVRARWTGATQHGNDYERYNKKPMFRYNAYFGVHTVHYLDVVEAGDVERTATRSLLLGALKGRLGRVLLRGGADKRILSPWAVRHIGRPTTLTFVAFVRPDGFPWIVPPVPTQPAGTRRLALWPAPHQAELAGLEPGTVVACFALNLAMESVLVRGRLSAWHRVLGARAGLLDIEEVYNSMPPKHGRIYPLEPLQPVTPEGNPREST